MNETLNSSDGLDLVVVGGCGHVGLPLALSFAESGLVVGIYDTDAAKVRMVGSGQMPFLESGAPEMLTRVVASGHLEVSDSPTILKRTNVVVMVIGTPIDEFMNPSMRLFERIIDELIPQLQEDPLVILRSTVYPGTTQYVMSRFVHHGKGADVVSCPERVAEGHALEEIRNLPQLIGASSDRAFERASTLFRRLDVEIVRTTPEEAELAKLLNNAWRYVRFAVANQFFQIANRAGINYDRVLHAVRHNYPRAADLPGPGFAAGPCLLKDTMQLAAFSSDHFPMGQAAMLINEGLPSYIVDMLDHRRSLRGRTIGILGMAFKGESDDPRTSLSYKLRKLALFKGATVLCTDPYVRDPDLATMTEVLDRADMLIVGAPHAAYRSLALDGREVIDIWGITGQGIRL